MKHDLHISADTIRQLSEERLACLQQTQDLVQSTLLMARGRLLDKKVNDVYGHTAGDHVLRETGRLVLQTIRKIESHIPPP